MITLYNFLGNSLINPIFVELSTHAEPTFYLCTGIFIQLPVPRT